jgi:hypothetical protein
MNNDSLVVQTFALTKHFNSLVAVGHLKLELNRGELFSPQSQWSREDHHHQYALLPA